MRITTLKYLKRRSGGSLEIELESGELLEIDPELAVRFHLVKGMDLRDEAREELERDQARLTARRRVVGYLTGRKKSRREAEQYLRRLRFSDDATEFAMLGAMELGMIDDESYAAAYARTHQRSAAKGPNAIRHELLARGVDRDLVEKTLQPSDTPEAQREAARSLAAKKSAGLRTEDPRKTQQKLAQFLIRKGYDPEIAIEVAREAAAADE